MVSVVGFAGVVWKKTDTQAFVRVLIARIIISFGTHLTCTGVRGGGEALRIFLDTVLCM